jgi:hypothetical protein
MKKRLRKIKKYLKKIFPTQTRPVALVENEIRVAGKVEILRVKDICDMLGINVPLSYRKESKHFPD